ncbi:MAG TPA: hypothetical protein VFC53_00205 [Dehalococcoidia bacterium]|nr:hypothetical protein [Dehalococcoidia bacterium]
MLAIALALAAGACRGGHGSSGAAASVAASVTADATPTPAPDARDLAQQIGDRADLPANDPIDLAARYGLTPGRVPRQNPAQPEPDVGSQRDFYVMRISGAALAHAAPPTVETVHATLRAKSAHAYFYEDDALDVDASSVQAAADQFESSVWPTVTSAFGLPPDPGVDGDPRIIVLQSDLGGGAGGYVSADDVYPRAVRPYSNEAEMLYLDRTLRAGGAAFNVVLAHEFQHVVHLRLDLSEEAWVNEGLSEDASGLVGGAVSSIDAFEAQPQTQLNGWDSVGSLPHYGAGAAFFRYLASRYGGDREFGAIAGEASDGVAGVDAFLESVGAPQRFRDVFADWVAANVLNRAAGPYANPERPLDVRIPHDLSPGTPASGDANQFGTDYYALPPGGEFSLRFQGQADTQVLPVTPVGGGAMLWANAGDNIDTRLTHEVDLTAVAAPVLTFRAWYDIERWFDWAYVSVSTDGGASWRALAGEHTTTDDPLRSSYGPGYTGKSGGGADAQWVDERVDLSAYAGQKILLRFEYVTDGSTHGEGWAIDDIAISGTSASDADGRGWQSEGWVRIDRPLPQTWLVRVIEKLAGGDARVVDVPVDAAGRGDMRISPQGVEEAVLAVAGTTEGTNEQASYTVSLDSP